MWFSHLLQENDDATVKSMFNHDENPQMLQEIEFRGNPYKIIQSVKSTVLR